MNQHYPDLIDKLGQPFWWDECGVPRYLPFDTSLLNNIYAEQAALMRIACQGCGRECLVAMSWGMMDKVVNPYSVPLEDLVKDKSIHYGDPPNYGCCSGGPTMNCEDLAVLEFWKRNHKEYVGDDGIVTDNEKYFEWRRLPDLEVKLMDNPVTA